MVQSALGIAVFFILLAQIVIPEFQTAQDTATSGDVETLIYLVLLLFLVGVAIASYKKHS